MMNEVARTAWATAKTNADFVCVETCSGYRLTTTDPQGKQHLLPVDVSDHELGIAVLDSLCAQPIYTAPGTPEGRSGVV